MKNSRRIVLGAAVLALSAMGWNSAAQGQYRVSADGHVNDANNRIGSGGYNGDRTNYPDNYGNGSNIINNQVNNQIVTGNVQGLKYFHGNTGEFDPNTIQTFTGMQDTDRFLAISAPTNYDARSTGAPSATAYYSTDKLAIQPQNFTATANGAGFVPSQAITNLPSDTRLGVINNSPLTNVQLPTPGELELPGPVDPSGNPSELIASPLYGMRQWNASDSSDAYFLSRYSNVLPNGPVQQARANDAQVMQMRNELNSTMINPNGQTGDNQQGNNPAGSNNNNPAGNNGTGPNGVSSQTGFAPANANLAQSARLGGANPSNGALPTLALSSGLDNSPVGTNSTLTPGTRQQLLIPADQQSEQLKQLEQRLARSRQQMSPQQAEQAYNQEVQLNNDAKAKAEELAKAATPTAVPKDGATPPNSPETLPPGGAPLPGTVKPEETPAAPMVPMLNGPLGGGVGAEKPYVISSLATGIKAKGLADLLTSAETEMRDGKFSNALDTYDMARQVAPNNPFVTLGRAFAELGAGSYGRAESDLRQSFIAEQGAVLLGQYDLRGFLGEDRLKSVVKDLKEINAKENNERPAFLLAYIAHNVGDDENAAKLLNDAEQRSGGNDPIVQLMRDNWQLKK